MLVVADTSALLALASCNNLFLLDALFREVRVPPAVFQECTVADKPEAERLTDYLRDKVLAVADLSEFVIVAMGLGRGERVYLSESLRRLDLLAETDRYVADLVAEVGPPTAAQRTRAAALARRLARRQTRKVG